jgi:hypothetical protein
VVGKFRLVEQDCFTVFIKKNNIFFPSRNSPNLVSPAKGLRTFAPARPLTLSSGGWENLAGFPCDFPLLFFKLFTTEREKCRLNFEINPKNVNTNALVGQVPT